VRERLLGLAGMAVECVALSPRGVRIVQLVTVDLKAARCPGCGQISTSLKEWVCTQAAGSGLRWWAGGVAVAHAALVLPHRGLSTADGIEQLGEVPAGSIDHYTAAMAWMMVSIFSRHGKAPHNVLIVLPRARPASEQLDAAGGVAGGAVSGATSITGWVAATAALGSGPPCWFVSLTAPLSGCCGGGGGTSAWGWRGPVPAVAGSVIAVTACRFGEWQRNIGQPGRW